MLTPTPARYACNARQLRLFFILAACLFFSNAIGAAHDVVVAEQQFAGPVMQLNGEVITQFYYPAADQQYYIPQPQLKNPLPAQQISFPIQQPRFLSSDPLYIDPNPTPPPQINPYGEVIVGKFIVEPEPCNADAKSKPLSQCAVDQNVDDQEVDDQNNPKTPDPSTSKTEIERADALSAQVEANSKPNAPAQQGISDEDNDQPNQVASYNQAKAQTEAQPAPDVGLKASEPEPAVANSQRSDSFMQPRGPIAEEQRTHLFWVTVLTSIAIIPVFILLPLILFKYRRGRKQQETYQPKWDSSSILELLMWGVPALLVTFMSARLWQSTHQLDPYAEISSRNKTINVQVVGLDWKWLFIYPDHGIATVGEFTIPIKQPASMTLTTDTVMQSFVIPALGGQIYAMPGMTTKLNLIADQLGTMEGENTQFNGDGFAEQKFLTHVVPPEQFEAWVKKVKQDGVALDEASYKTLAKRTTQKAAVADLGTDAMPEGVVYFTLDDEQFFMKIMMRYMNHKPLKDEDQPGSPAYGVSNETSLSVEEDH